MNKQKLITAHSLCVENFKRNPVNKNTTSFYVPARSPHIVLHYIKRAAVRMCVHMDVLRYTTDYISEIGSQSDSGNIESHQFEIRNQIFCESSDSDRRT